MTTQIVIKWPPKYAKIIPKWHRNEPEMTPKIALNWSHQMTLKWASNHAQNDLKVPFPPNSHQLTHKTSSNAPLMTLKLIFFKSEIWNLKQFNFSPQIWDLTMYFKSVISNGFRFVLGRIMYVFSWEPALWLANSQERVWLLWLSKKRCNFRL